MADPMCPNTFDINEPHYPTAEGKKRSESARTALAAMLTASDSIRPSASAPAEYAC